MVILVEVEAVPQSEAYKAQSVSGQYVKRVWRFEVDFKVVEAVVEYSTTSWWLLK